MVNKREDNPCNETDPVKYNRIKRLQWPGHVTRMNDEQNPKNKEYSSAGRKGKERLEDDRMVWIKTAKSKRKELEETG